MHITWLKEFKCYCCTVWTMRKKHLNLGQYCYLSKTDLYWKWFTANLKLHACKGQLVKNKQNFLQAVFVRRRISVQDSMNSYFLMQFESSNLAISHMGWAQSKICLNLKWVNLSHSSLFWPNWYCLVGNTAPDRWCYYNPHPNGLQTYL